MALAAIAWAGFATGAVEAFAAGSCDQETPECRGDFDGDRRVSVDELVTAVRNSLLGCPDSQPGGLSLSVRVERPEGAAGWRIVAALQNQRDAAVAYRSGCSALCRPLRYQAIYFTVIGPNGAEVFVSSPCIGPLLCAERILELAPGEQVERALSINGTRWEQEGDSLFYCGTCAERDLDPGRYVVITRFPYSEDLDPPFSFAQQIVAFSEFTWP